MTNAPRSPPSSGSFFDIAHVAWRSTRYMPIRFTPSVISNGIGLAGPSRPAYLLDRPLALRVLLVILVPGVFGLICGWVLGHSKTIYIALQIVAAIGGYVAGFEHRSGREAAVRGFIGGAFFGGGIVLMH